MKFLNAFIINKKNISILIAFSFISLSGSAQSQFPYKNPKLSIDQRVKDLISRMTVQEKFWQLFMIPGDLEEGNEKYKAGIFGFQVSTKGNSDAAGQLLSYSSSATALETAKKINSIQKYFVEETRLGIPIIAFDETLHGLVREGATSFPQSIALSSTWDIKLMGQVATAIARETKSRGIRQILSPVVNVATDVRWGRVEETYGEDPFLSSEMGVAFVTPFEKMDVVTTPKHFLANSGDGGRDSYPIDINERLLEEIYLPPFKACFQRGGSRSVMTSYNSLNGSPCTANNWLLNTKLKQQMNFSGFIISDASAVGGANVLHFTAKDYPEASANAINNGLDVIFQTAYDHYQLFIPPFLDGRINEKIIDEAVKRVLTVKFQLGLFEHPYVDEKEVSKWNGNPLHKALSKEAALKSIVLLKNENNLLPLQKSTKKLAVIGVDAVEARLGGYSGPGNRKVNMLDGIKNKLGKSAMVTYAPGCGRSSVEWVTIPSENLSVTVNGKKENGLLGEYFNNVNMTGKPAVTRIDKEMNFRWTLYSPHPDINYDFYSVKWTGKLKAPASGKFKIGLDGNDGYRLYLNGKLVIDNWKNQSYHTQLVDYYFEEGKEYDIKVDFFESSGSVWFKLVWNVGVDNDWQKKIDDAVTVAKNAEASVVVVGIEEGESLDRAYLSLPGHQEEMINQIAATGKPVAVVLVGGSAITMTKWINNVSSVIDAWYPGEEGGNAIADVLFGDYNPAGRLPITFPIEEAQLPLVYNHKPTGRTDDYLNLTGQPLFPFGYGLSYTKFEYGNLKFDTKNIAKGESTKVHCTIKNIGSQAGDEVVQLYVRDLISSVARPIKELKGFQRIYLKPGEEKEVSFQITPDLLKMLNEHMQWVVEPGEFRIMIGASSKDIRLRDVITVVK
ncbi:glycoside hydrolase family 3 C-terminal domain-containing protein [Solitalea lacus]|uniref:glycoside hydrolase family 3 C-terminal domain-containing protein n=1 Tax=Solitalea lacus TaxID=2911172 RepID=UPI001EDC5C26|nr:glycoside hydrolase family 3 C-terminal domain-containing protein [Solitalea lacus]UKJ05879.1 glycoside hydrolase family 3 C-terminal domain-containing protein [Solitalea lacus]